MPQKEEKRKIAVVLPGIGYSIDRPLLYYGSKLAKQAGYQLVRVSYEGLKLEKGAFRAGIEAGVRQAEEQLRRLREGIPAAGRFDAVRVEGGLEAADEVLFLSKSIGTAIGAALDAKYHLNAKHVLFTPLEETFDYFDYDNKQPRAIAFSGTKDQWADHETVVRLAKERGIPLTAIPDGNHSLECGIVDRDIRALEQVMQEVREFLSLEKEHG